MLELEDAVARILQAVPVPRPEAIPLANAYNRFLLESVTSPIDLPLFDNSAMDGYAVRAAEVMSAKGEAPVKLKLVGKIAAGETFEGKLEAGQCIRIFTGSALPAGADCVVMQEDTRTDPSDPASVLVTDTAKPLENVRLRGQDIRAGATLLRAGDKVTAGAIALLAASGITSAKVGQRPKVALLATGSELREPGVEIKPGQIYESNRLALSALISAVGGIPEIFPLVRDDLASTRTALENAFAQCDLVVTSGGVSVGEMDFVKQGLEDTGGKLEFWKVAIKPGRPFVYGQRNGKFLFGLPGNPVSAFVTFLLLVRPALLRWQGAADVNLPVSRGELAEPINNQGSRRHFVRVRMDSKGKIHSAGAQASHMLSSLASANGLLDVGADTSLTVGHAVDVLRWD
jgi:molybdopterin molybdotransferase